MMTEPTDKTIRMASDLHQRVKIEAAKRGVTVRDLVEQAVREWLDRREQQEETHDDR